MLKEMTLDGTFTDKVKVAIDRLKQYEPPEGYYLAFSGGKDSVVCYDLLFRNDIPFDAHFHFTTVDPPELLQFIKENYPQVEWHRPKESMFQLIVRKGFPPTRQKRYCCSILKESGGTNRTVVSGIRWDESKNREKRKVTEKYGNKIMVNPIIDWKTEDVWEYIKKNNVKYCSLYDKGYDRIGCIMCPIQKKSGMLRDIERYPKFYKAYMRAFQRMIDKADKTKIRGWDTAEDVMSWFINCPSLCAEQCQLFE